MDPDSDLEFFYFDTTTFLIKNKGGGDNENKRVTRIRVEGRRG